MPSGSRARRFAEWGLAGGIVRFHEAFGAPFCQLVGISVGDPLDVSPVLANAETLAERAGVSHVSPKEAFA